MTREKLVAEYSEKITHIDVAIASLTVKIGWDRDDSEEERIGKKVLLSNRQIYIQAIADLECLEV